MNHDGHGGGGKHSWLMMACCVPMLLIAVVLAATGVVSWAFLLYALGCTAMMALMMRGMGGMGGMHGGGGSTTGSVAPRDEPTDGVPGRRPHDTTQH